MTNALFEGNPLIATYDVTLSAGVGEVTTRFTEVFYAIPVINSNSAPASAEAFAVEIADASDGVNKKVVVRSNDATSTTALRVIVAGRS